MSFTLNVVGQTQQLSTTLKDQFGNTLFGVGLPKFTSSNPNVASVSQSGLVTATGPGTATITVSMQGTSASTTVTVGLYAAVIAACNADNVPIRKFRDARIAVSDGVGVQTLPSVPGVTGPALKFYENGGVNIHRPSVVNGTVRTGGTGGQITMASENWNGDTSTDLSAGVWKLFFGAFVTAGGGVPCAGYQHASDRVGEAILQGGFDNPQTVDSFFYTDGNPSGAPHTYFWSTKTPLGSSTCGIFGWFIPKGDASSSDNLNATPWAKSVRIGVEGPRTLPHGQTTDNQFTAFPSGPYRDFYGPEPSGTVGSPVISSTVDTLLASDLELGAPPTPGIQAAWIAYCQAHPAYVAPVQLVESYIGEGPGDSRDRGNGASDSNHTIAAQGALLLGPLWQTDNLGISGDQWDNALVQPYLNNRLAGIYDAARKWNIIKIGPLGVNSFNDTTNYPPSGMTAATALARLDSLITAIRALYTVQQVQIMVACETTQAGGIPQAQAWNTGVFARAQAGTIQIVARPDKRWELQDGFNTTYFSDGLHSTDAGYLVYAQEDVEALVGNGADGILKGIVITPATVQSVSHTGTLQLTAALVDDRGSTVTGYTFVWTSSDVTKATVNSSGLVTGVAVGNCVITVTTANGALQMQCRVNVT